MDNAIEILEKRNKLFFPQIHNVQKKFRRSSCVYRQSETFENTRLRNNIIGQGTTETWTSSSQRLLQTRRCCRSVKKCEISGGRRAGVPSAAAAP